MFDELSQRFEDAVKSLRGQASITETNVEGALKQVRRALLEADVSLAVVQDFVEEVRRKAVGSEVVRGVSPDQKFIQLVHEQLVDTMGGENAPLAAGGKPGAPSVVLMAGLQGAGKTTATAKLGLHLKEQGRKALLVGADVYRPAAIEQLKTLGSQIGVEVFSLGTDAKPEDIAAAGITKAREEGFDTVLVDTAGRLQIDKSMMEEMVRIRQAVQPDEVLLVVDSMIGQEAADLTRAFHEQVGITGAVLTKLDGDSRGGAALSIRKVSGAPIKFIGTGEKVEALQPFHPERMASRILGMGDVLTLVEKATKEVELADVARMQQKLQEASFDFSDFLQQMRMIRRMGSLGGLMKLIPGMNKIDDGMLKQGEEQLKKIEAMIGSMTEVERQQPELLASQPSRRRRIASGCGHSSADVDKVLADFQKMRGFMQQMTRGGGMPGMPGMPGPMGGGSGAGQRVAKPAKKRKGFGQL
jgi:signal recognition particle subunit SRP54